FFFQAEDGIRDRNVTGVQTCALPIFSATSKDILDAGTAVHMFTGSGNPLSSAAALETISIIENDHLIDNAKNRGDYFIQQLKELQNKYEIIGDVRGKGLALGVELVKDRHTKTPASEETAAVCYRA